MKKIFTLIAAFLFTAMGTWAEEKVYQTKYLLDFEDATKINDGWTYSSTWITGSQKSFNNSNYLFFATRNENAYLDFTSNEAFTNASDYRFSFTWGYSPVGASQGAAEDVLIVYGTDGAVLFKVNVNAPSSGTAASTYIVKNSSDITLCTLTGDLRFDDNIRKFYTFTITADATNGVNLNVKAYGSATGNSYILSDSFSKITKLYQKMQTSSSGKFNPRATFDNIRLEEATTGEVANDPTMSLVGVSTTSRTYKINYSDGETLYYGLGTAEDAPESYSTASGSTFYNYTVNNSGTIYAYTKNGSAESNIVKQVVEVSAIKLNAPTFEKTAYNEGVYSIKITSNQESVVLRPVGEIKYSVDGGAEQTYTSEVQVAVGSTISAWTVNSNYANSNVVELTAKAQPTVVDVWNIDFRELNTTGDDYSINWTTGDDKTVYSNCSVDEKFGDFWRMMLNGEVINQNLGVQLNKSAEAWLIRKNRMGFYNMIAGTRSFAIDNLTVGQYVRTVGAGSSNGSSIFAASGALQLQQDLSYGSTAVYKVVSNGVGVLSIPRNAYIYTLEVLGETLSPSINSADFGTFSAAFNAKIEGAKVYTAKVDGEKIDATLIESGIVPAGKGVLLVKEGETVTATYTTEEANEAAFAQNGLKATTLANGSLATLEPALVLSGNTFKSYTGDAFAANKAYFPYSTSEAKPLSIVFNDGETTGISAVMAVSASKSMKAVINNKLVIVKGDKKYNVAGCEMK